MTEALANWRLWSLCTTHSPVKISNVRDKFKKRQMQSGKCVRVTEKLLLYGSTQLNLDINKVIFQTVHDFIDMTGRL